MIEVDIVTPNRKIVAGARCASVRLPGAKGELQVLPGHRELITALGTGLLSFAEDGVERKFAISYGFAEVRDNRVLILAETCEEGSEIDLERAKSAQKKAEQALGAVLAEGQFRKYELKVQRAIVRQHAAS